MFDRGLIEGFYGRMWTWRQRHTILPFMRRHGFDSYIYAPKGDARLRQLWQRDWPLRQRRSLASHRAACRAAGLRWGVGLSPLCDVDGMVDSAALRRRLDQLAALEPDLLCLLFDDSKIVDGAAARQAQLVAEARQQLGASVRLIVCPSYYSTDPVLAQLFGPMPEAYLEQLGQALAPDIDVFWTGERVCSADFSAPHLRWVGELLRRTPVLWDNYPVNDGRHSCRHLHLLPFPPRPAHLCELASGHFINPMNQSRLSQLPLAVLGRCPDGSAEAVAQHWSAALTELYSAPLAALLSRDAQRFATGGLDALTALQRRHLSAEYGRVSEPAAREIREWLDGDYAFDPACLSAV